MTNGLRVRESEADTIAYRAAVEAVIGVTMHGIPHNGEEGVRMWLGRVFNENINQIAPAMHYAQRIIHGPKPVES